MSGDYFKFEGKLKKQRSPGERGDYKPGSGERIEYYNKKSEWGQFQRAVISKEKYQSRRLNIISHNEKEKTMLHQRLTPNAKRK